MIIEYDGPGQYYPKVSLDLRSVMAVREMMPAGIQVLTGAADWFVIHTDYESFVRDWRRAKGNRAQ